MDDFFGLLGAAGGFDFGGLPVPFALPPVFLTIMDLSEVALADSPDEVVVGQAAAET